MSLSPRIKFRCSECEKPLSIGRKKAGATVTCPKCQSEILVPMDTELIDREDSEENPFSEFEVFDDEFDEPELIYDDSADSLHNQPAKLNDRLSVPRKVIYLQGALLGAVAILFFLLGLIVGSKGQSQSAGNAKESTVRGMVVLDDFSADEGAVVFLLPSKSRPSSKFESEELRPGRVFTSANPEVALIRQFGGNVCTTNRAGQFEMKVSPNKEYILLVVSGNSSRSLELESEIHTNVGHYFTSLDNLADGKTCYFKRVLPMTSIENVGEIVVKSDG